MNTIHILFIVRSAKAFLAYPLTNKGDHEPVQKVARYYAFENLEAIIKMEDGMLTALAKEDKLLLALK